MTDININSVIKYLKEYDGKSLRIMEVCGTHTSAIFKNGIRSLISPKIELISGPGCPVCVTPTNYIDKCIDYSKKKNHILLTFGDMIKVPGSKESLADAKGEGAKVEIMYSPFEVIEKAKKNSTITYVIAAVGFETTAPTYGLLLKEVKKKGIENIKLLTALKTIIPPLKWICNLEESEIDGFLCPGHVSVITGSKIYEELAAKFKKPFIVAGFSGEHILTAIYDLIKKIDNPTVDNLYKNAVKEDGNIKAKEVINEVYETGTATWRGMGDIDNSGLYLKGEYRKYDVGSRGLNYDMILPKNCSCKEVIIGKVNPNKCEMFGKGCTPTTPVGPCMVSAEGACGIWYRNR